MGVVIFDEVHERNLTTDLGLALTLHVAATIRPDLRILAMSATPDVEGLTRLADAPVIESDGRMFDVEMHWMPQTPTGGSRGVRTDEGRRGSNQQWSPPCPERFASRPVTCSCSSPGFAEIRRTESQLGEIVGPDVDIYALAGALTTTEQDLALAPSPPGRRRVVLSTDIAETSLTVDGVRVPSSTADWPASRASMPAAA